MLKRLASLLFGIGLIGLGVFLFATPERAFAVHWLSRWWPLFLILAGLVRVAGYLIDRRPRSPVGGVLTTAVGGIILAANLRGDQSLIRILGIYWFWLLLALIIGRVLRQYTGRAADAAPTPAFTPGAIILMMFIVGGGLAANYLSKNGQYLNNLNVRIGKFGDVRNYIIGNRIAIEDEAPQNFNVSPNARLTINSPTGEVEVVAASQAQASARLIKRIRVAGEEEAKQVAQNIHLQISPDGKNYQVNVSAAGVQTDFSTAIVITLPLNVAVGVEVAAARGSVKLSGLRGDHTIRNSEQVEIHDNTGRVTVENPRGPVELNRIRGDVTLVNLQRNVELRDIAGAITLDLRNASANIEQATGPVQARGAEARMTLNEIGMASSAPNPNSVSAPAATPLIKLDDLRNCRVSLQGIKGAVVVNADRSRIEAEAITGDLTIANSNERIRANRINGMVRIKSDDGAVELEEIRGGVTVDATRDVVVRNFRGPLSVSSRSGEINLSTDEKIASDLKAVNERGRISLSMPEDGDFRLDASSNFGRVRVSGFNDLKLSLTERSSVIGYHKNESAPLVSLRSKNGEIQVKSSGLALARQE